MKCVPAATLVLLIHSVDYSTKRVSSCFSDSISDQPEASIKCSDIQIFPYP